MATLAGSGTGKTGLGQGGGTSMEIDPSAVGCMPGYGMAVVDVIPGGSGHPTQ